MKAVLKIQAIMFIMTMVFIYIDKAEFKAAKSSIVKYSQKNQTITVDSLQDEQDILFSVYHILNLVIGIFLWLGVLIMPKKSTDSLVI